MSTVQMTTSAAISSLPIPSSENASSGSQLSTSTEHQLESRIDAFATCVICHYHSPDRVIPHVENRTCATYIQLSVCSDCASSPCPICRENSSIAPEVNEVAVEIPTRENRIDARMLRQANRTNQRFNAIVEFRTGMFVGMCRLVTYGFAFAIGATIALSINPCHN